MPEAAGDMAQDRKLGVVGVVDATVGEPANHGVQKNDEYHAEGRDEEPSLALVGEPLRHDAAEGPDNVEHDEGCQAHGGVQLRVSEIFKRVDDDEVRRAAGVYALYAHHGGDLAGGDTDSGAGHEGGDGNEGDELDNEAETSEADKQQDRPRY